MASSNLRSSLSFPNLLLSCLNFTLLLLSAASLAPTLLLRTPPTFLGLALLAVSSLSLLSALLGFFSHITRFCFLTHLSLLLSSLVAQLLSILALFTRENSSLAMLKSPRDPREAKVLARLECGILMAMFIVQTVVLAVGCVVQSCWVREYEGLEAEREWVQRKRSRRNARVQEEAVANAEKIAEVKRRELEEKMKGKYGLWVKTDFEG